MNAALFRTAVLVQNQARRNKSQRTPNLSHLQVYMAHPDAGSNGLIRIHPDCSDSFIAWAHGRN
jgi:hypothetical protein